MSAFGLLIQADYNAYDNSGGDCGTKSLSIPDPQFLNPYASGTVNPLVRCIKDGSGALSPLFLPALFTRNGPDGLGPEQP